jgi:hypothetical protein
VHRVHEEPYDDLGPLQHPVPELSDITPPGEPTRMLFVEPVVQCPSGKFETGGGVQQSTIERIPKKREAVGMVATPRRVAPAGHVDAGLRVEDVQSRRVDRRAMVSGLAQLEEQIESADVHCQHNRAGTTLSQGRRTVDDRE